MTTTTSVSTTTLPACALRPARFARALLAAAALGALAALALPTPAHADDKLGVTIGGEVAPGVWGRIELGRHQPPPAVIYPQPVFVPAPPPAPGVPAVVMPAGYAATPVYIVAPPGHIRHWAQWCGYYGACGRPVYFVDVRHARRYHVHPVRYVQPVVYPAPVYRPAPPLHAPPAPQPVPRPLPQTYPHPYPVYPR